MWEEAFKISAIGLAGVFLGLGVLVLALEVFGAVASKLAKRGGK